MVFAEFMFQAADIFTTAVGTFDLAVAKQVAARQQLVLQQGSGFAGCPRPSCRHRRTERSRYSIRSARIAIRSAQRQLDRRS